MNEKTELRFKVAPVWKGSYNPNTTYFISDEVSFTSDNVPVGETTDVTYGHYRSLKNNNTDPLTSSDSWLLILDLSTIETVTQQGKEYNQEFNDNETLRKDNERQRVENETIRVNNELTRVSNENERKSAETRRVDAENNRGSAENNRKSNETARQTTELQRKSKEEQRVGNENARISSETTRQANEVTRQSNETNRRSSETTRQSNESTRQANETVRQQQEGSATDSPNPTGSRWARYKQAENERTQLFNASQNNRTTLYNTAEGTPEDAASASGSRWARFKKAEETRDAIVDAKVEDITNLQNDVENLKDTKANKDGYYSQMTVGAAETLVGETVDSADYIIRPTGGADNEVANGAASVIGMEGHTEKFNQLIKNGNFDGNTSGWYPKQSSTIQAENNTLLMTWNSSYSDNGIYQPIGYIVGHKYYICGTIKNTASEQRSYYLGQPYGVKISTSLGVGEKKAVSGIRTVETATGNGYVTFSLLGQSNVDNSVEATNIMLIDLTAIFGAGNEPSTVAEFESWLAKNVGLKPYYGYNAGALLSAQTLGVKTYGQNLLNPTTRQARLITYDWEENSNVYTIKNVLSGATATFTPDATGVAEVVDISGGTLDITSYGNGILELSAATSETYVCMKWDGGKDDDVVPFEEHTQNFDVRKVYGKVNGAGEYVQCFPNGLKSAGTAKDSLTATGATKVIGDVDLGTLDYVMLTTYLFQGNLNIPAAQSSNVPFNAIVPVKYIIGTQNNWQSVDYQISRNNSVAGGILVKDKDYTADSKLKVSLNGVPLYYELATPINYTDLVYRDGGIDTPIADVLFNIDVDNWSIEEQLLTPYDENGCPTAVPAKISTNYGMDAVEEIDTIKHTYVSAYNEQEFSDAQKAQARRNIGAVEADGTYPNMSVGIAKNLAGENAVEAEYTYRPSNGTIGTATGVANITTVKGKTLKWNQLVQNGNFASTSGWHTVNGTLTTANNIGTFEASSIAPNTRIEPDSNTGIEINHKYFYRFNIKSQSNKVLNIRVTLGGSDKTYVVSSNGDTIKDITSLTTTQYNVQLYLYKVTTGGEVGDKTDISSFNVIDLTDLFGAGKEPSTVEEFEALYPLDYYDYNAGTLVNNNASAIETIGFNQWDEEWELGTLNTTTGENVNSSIQIRSKNYISVISGKTYYCNMNSAVWCMCYDTEKNLIQTPGISSQISENASKISLREFTIPSNCRYIRFYLAAGYGTTYNHDICINISDPAKNGTYEPYEKHTFYFDKVLQGEGSLATIKGKLNGEGESVVVFPDGLRKAGNVFDEIKGNVAIKRIGSRAYTSGDESDTTVITDGTNTYYALATPETYILDQTVTGGYQVNANGTERRLPEDTASSVNAPVNYSVIYPINAVKTIIDLPYNYISAESMTNFITELATKLGAFLNATIAITPTYDQTQKQYDYNITITQNQ